MGNQLSQVTAAIDAFGSIGTTGTTNTIPRSNHRFQSLSQIQQELIQIGMDNLNMVIGVDFTKSNAWTGKHSFGGQNLHSIIPDGLNPYEQAISIIAKTLPDFDEEPKIPCYGFGDVTTHDKSVFCFNQDDQPCIGLEGVLARYRSIVPNLQMSGPTSYGPIIRQAIRRVIESGYEYHLLLILADGQVTGRPDESDGQLSQQEQDTISAVVEASNYPLSIVVIGIGDGPWEHMSLIDDQISRRKFDNLHFVNFTAIMGRGKPGRREANFALMALMEIPEQQQFIIENDMLNRPIPLRQALPGPLQPPTSVLTAEGPSKEEEQALAEQLQLQLHQLVMEKASLSTQVQQLDHENQNLKELLTYTTALVHMPSNLSDASRYSGRATPTLTATVSDVSARRSESKETPALMANISGLSEPRSERAVKALKATWSGLSGFARRRPSQRMVMHVMSDNGIDRSSVSNAITESINE
eukprot:TRINITY_DN6741_c0_g2_i1.p1 TRINITY_DN6741_c0_g2~~TRINITY_DN6741_c0_g2_i1.p1  ORF type:complete len:470 (-),score=61.00 TRINITY_DN6741_c0_g2_i1:234-1643(-)